MDKESDLKSKVHYDPGWNDPPLYSYDTLSAAGPSNSTKKVNILNKRVAYPLGQQKVMSGGMNPTLPPTNNAVPLPPSSAPKAPDGVEKVLPQAKEEEPLDKEEALSRVKEGFREILETSGDIQQSADEINKRLSTMFRMWEEDRLNPRVHRRILELVEALRTKDYDRADHLHVGLAVDHPSLCASWIPGVRRIVQHLKSSTQKIEDNSENCVSEPLPNLHNPDV